MVWFDSLIMPDFLRFVANGPTFLQDKNLGSNQTVWMLRLIWAGIQPKVQVGMKIQWRFKINYMAVTITAINETHQKPADLVLHCFNKGMVNVHK